MVKIISHFFITLIALLLISGGINAMAPQAKQLLWMKSSMTKLEKELVQKYGEGQHARITQGLKQVKEFWKIEDGDAAVFEEFVKANFAGDQATLDAMFTRYENNFEKLYGHMQELSHEIRKQVEQDMGPTLPFDDIFAGYDATAHIGDDFFANKIAFIVLLNFPMTTLEQRLKEGEKWNHRQWAEARLGQIFSKRVPADINLAIAQASAETDKYISEYNIWMHHVVNEKGERLFPPKLRLLSHWNLRDELKADYTDTRDGLLKQKTIQQVMERIITQSIPAIVVNNPNVDWNPYTNEVKKAAVKDDDSTLAVGTKITNAAEPDTRYAMILKNFHARKKMDPYSPTAPTYIARKFDEEREITEDRVYKMLTEVVSSPAAAKIGKLIEARLGRPLEPFDIWYNGFKGRGKYSEAELDAIITKKYPNVGAYEKDIPNLLEKLNFSKDKAKYLADNIRVEAARGSGQAVGAALYGAKANLQTRIDKTGMNYKGFNIAIHEMGHTVEQTFSLNNVDHWFLSGVPNIAFTEAFAFIFQGHDLDLLGLKEDGGNREALKTIDDFWNIYEIAGVSLVDMEVWNWMYKHSKAKPAELKTETLEIAKRIWNKYYAPVFGKKDSILLAVYSHMISYPLYLADYTLGYMIKFQDEEKMKKAGGIGPEFEKMATQGRIAPDLWMKNATGSVVSPNALLAATEEALKDLEKDSKK